MKGTDTLVCYFCDKPAEFLVGTSARVLPECIAHAFNMPRPRNRGRRLIPLTKRARERFREL